MTQPRTDRRIEIAPHPKRVRVTFAGKVIADTTAALTLLEESYPPVFYIPRADTDMNLLKRTDHTTHCPFKGDASYYSIVVGDRTADNAVWTYEQPFPLVVPVGSYLAFYGSKVDAIEEL
ncbi:MAG: hypothetical protein JWN71_3754 [Xanthobacteraceae bacterium]|jgi:uncharacterized protein (DUF427 family)|nr:hypothetical protein [Xanthobacteraceae bacterium]